jgi:hypothetical protein
MSKTENLRFQRDIQKIETGYKMLSDIETKIKGYFNTEDISNADFSVRTNLPQPPVKKEFS